ncbi:phosphopyruvate hydratase [Streptomyces triticirhizae]|uniref:Enolase n=1 Tax=Streptomyces triticirhizae TaxID=2483353 RepID=A0A3M2LWV0_9ACTN|nr:phosphopyruvate hydratase [Streptomyces triticirhizae]RMI41949.1 phosphopyruvate hydratase [Streptomyces triticirhizae]
MAETTIDALLPCEVLDSRGNPTVACEVRLRGGAGATVSVPSGASTGSHEAVELRDGGDRYAGRGVRRAVASVEGEIAELVLGLDATDQIGLDAALRTLDGTDDLNRLGANAVLSVSLASSLAAAASLGQPPYRWFGAGSDPLLPMPMVNILSGGAHAGGALDIQDLLAVPVGADSFAQALEWVARVRRATGEVLTEAGHDIRLVADEGGFGVPLPSNTRGLEVLTAGIERAGLRPGDQVGIAIDVAATELLDEGDYHLAAEGRRLDTGELTDLIGDWCARFPVLSIEDPLAEDDWEGWREITQRLGGGHQLVGDDLFVTTATRLRRGIESGVGNAVLVKPNQCGLLSDAHTVVRTAQAAGYATVLSARSGETEDSWLADLAVGWRTGQIKVGSLTRSERTAKWNRLLRIERELGASAEFAGAASLAPLSGTDIGTR